MSECSRMGAATVPGVLYDLRAYPALVLAARGRVHGELWLCPPETLPLLDSYEGVGDGLFARVRTDSDQGSCWTYVAGPRLLGALASAPIISSGRWQTPHRPTGD